MHRPVYFVKTVLFCGSPIEVRLVQERSSRIYNKIRMRGEKCTPAERISDYPFKVFFKITLMFKTYNTISIKSLCKKTKINLFWLNDHLGFTCPTLISYSDQYSSLRFLPMMRWAGHAIKPLLSTEYRSDMMSSFQPQSSD